MERKSIAFRVPDDVLELLQAEPGTNTTEKAVSALRRALGAEATPEASEAVLTPPGAIPAPPSDTAAKKAAALAVASRLRLTCTSAEAAQALAPHVSLAEDGTPLVDLGDGGAPVALDEETAYVLLHDRLATTGSSGSGGRSPREFKPPALQEPPSFARVGADGMVFVNVDAAAKMTEAEKRFSLQGGA